MPRRRKKARKKRKKRKKRVKRTRRRKKIRRSFTTTPIYTKDKRLLKKIAKQKGLGLAETLHKYVSRDAKRRRLI